MVVVGLNGLHYLVWFVVLILNLLLKLFMKEKILNMKITDMGKSLGWGNNVIVYIFTYINVHL